MNKLIGFSIGAILGFALSAEGQSITGGRVSDWMTQEQIEACSNMFSDLFSKHEQKSSDIVTCGDLKQLYEEHCKDQKPETEVTSPWSKDE